MVNEIAQWTLLAAVVVLLLGVFRQLALSLPVSTRAASNGPELNRVLPRPVLNAVRDVLHAERLPERTVVAFVTENCASCQRLLGSLEETKPFLDGHSLVLVAKKPSAAFQAALADVGFPVLEDRRGNLWERCAVTTTPLLVEIDADGKVLEKEVSHRVETILA